MHDQPTKPGRDFSSEALMRLSNRTLHGTFCAMLLASAVVTGCAPPPAASAPTPPKPPSVMVSLPVRREVTDYEEVTGRTEAVDTVEVRTRVTGYLKNVYFEDGATVEQG